MIPATRLKRIGSCSTEKSAVVTREGRHEEDGAPATSEPATVNRGSDYPSFSFAGKLLPCPAR